MESCWVLAREPSYCFLLARRQVQLSELVGSRLLAEARQTLESQQLAER